ncbi:hypothetical protein FF38_09013 [Lucilia cuprina]|uniref:Uncharacterized protein n=1 Tax=Lucilia cuprina TaxID=7375 RepID=A0A0L0C298_LUCCU|nr:hypothetical protein FF38_09013 [Lucilia cuprina]
MFAPRNSSPVAMYGKEEVAAYEIKLKKVLGLTVCSNAALDCSPISGLLAYPAGMSLSFTTEDYDDDDDDEDDALSNIQNSFMQPFIYL